MKLFELAFACHAYSRMTDFDKSWERVSAGAENPLDLDSKVDRGKLLKWLNEWGCRQFAVEHHALASKEILSWNRRFGGSLPLRGRNLLELDEQELEASTKAYGDLARRTASKRELKTGEESVVTIGATGAAKILYAIRPDAYPPWDEPIRKWFRLDGSAESYCVFLEKARKELRQLEEDCLRNNFLISKLPGMVGRPGSTLAKLIDEYYWVTISRGWSAPSEEEIRRWLEWK